MPILAHYSAPKIKETLVLEPSRPEINTNTLGRILGRYLGILWLRMLAPVVNHAVGCLEERRRKGKTKAPPAAPYQTAWPLARLATAWSCQPRPGRSGCLGDTFRLTTPYRSRNSLPCFLFPGGWFNALNFLLWSFALQRLSMGELSMDSQYLWAHHECTLLV